MNQKYWNEKSNKYCTEIFPGQIFVTDSDEEVLTFVGSNIAISFYDQIMNVGGMCNVLSPSNDDKNSSFEEYFAIYIINLLLTEIKNIGGQLRNLQVDLYGGVLLKTSSGGSNKNNRFILDYLKKNKLLINSQWIGGSHAKKIYYNPTAGIAEVRKLSAEESKNVHHSEIVYADKVNQLDKDSMPVFENSFFIKL